MSVVFILFLLFSLSAGLLFSQIACMYHVYMHMYMCSCVHLNCSLQNSSSTRIFQFPFSWTMQTMNSYARVSISRLNYVDRMKNNFFQVFTCDWKFSNCTEAS